MRREYPGVAPWEWEAHPEWLDRVYAADQAERDSLAIIESAKPTTA